VAQTAGFLEILKPELERRISRELFDPEQFTDLEKIAKAYIIRYTEGKAASWIFEFIDEVEKRTQALEKKERGEEEIDKFRIGDDGITNIPGL
jgi:biotin synthase-related radical SAM superfamily protein